MLRALGLSWTLLMIGEVEVAAAGPPSSPPPPTMYELPKSSMWANEGGGAPGERAPVLRDDQIADLFFADASLSLSVAEALEQADSTTEVFARLGARAGCEAFNLALDEGVNTTRDAWRRGLVAAVRATIPEPVLIQSRRLGAREGDAMLAPYRPKTMAALGDFDERIGSLTFMVAHDALNRAIAKAPVAGERRSRNLARLGELRAAGTRMCIVPPQD